MPPPRNVASPESQPESSSSASSGSSAGPSPAAAPLRRLRQIAALARTVSSQLDLEAVLTQLSVAMKSLRPDAHCSIRLVDPAAGGYRLGPRAGGLHRRGAGSSSRE